MADASNPHVDPQNPFSAKNLTGIYEEAYGWCERYANYHRTKAKWLFLLLALIIITIVATIMWFIIDPEHYKDSSKTFMYVFYIIAAPIYGVAVGLYKFHIREVARNEHFLMGFKRMYLAGASTEKGFGSEVRKSLTAEAFPRFEGQEKEKKLIVKPPFKLAGKGS